MATTYSFSLQLAFRSAQQNQRQLRHKVRRLLCIPENKNSTDSDPMASMGRELDDMITIYLRKSVEKFDLSICVDVSTKYNVKMFLNFLKKLLEYHLCHIS